MPEVLIHLIHVKSYAPYLLLKPKKYLYPPCLGVWGGPKRTPLRAAQSGTCRTAAAPGTGTRPR